MLRPILEGIRHRHQLSVAETDFHDQWQRAELGVAVVSGSVTQASEIADRVERFVWSRPDIEVTNAHRQWLEFDR